MDRDVRDALVVAQWPLCQKIVDIACSKFPPWFDRDEALGDAAEALVRAAERYDHTQSGFSHYAMIRVKWSVRDTRRRLDWKPRPLKNPKWSQPPPRFLITVDLVPEQTLDEMTFEDNLVGVLHLRYLLRLLTRRERQVMIASYVRHDTLAEIAKELDVTESRVCQIRTQALKSLRRQEAEEPG